MTKEERIAIIDKAIKLIEGSANITNITCTAPVRAWMCSALEQACSGYNSYSYTRYETTDLFPELFSIEHTYMTEYGCTSAWASAIINGSSLCLNMPSGDYDSIAIGRVNRIKVLEHLKTILK